MRVLVAGAHGKIARRFVRRLTTRGDSVVGVVRNPEHVEDLRADGAEPTVLDLESTDADTLARSLAGCDAAVFAAGAGPGSGVARKETVDQGGSVLLADACERAGVRRFVQVGSMGTTEPNPSDVDEVFGAYLDAKRASERDLVRRDLDWTTLRPGRLTDDSPTGQVALAESVQRAEITRDDVAHVLVALLDAPESARRALEVVNGDVPINDAVRAVLD